MSNQDYELKTDGTAVFHFDDITRTLKRPTLREYRELVESLGNLRDELIEASGGDTEVNVPVKLQFDKLLGWLDEVCQTLSGEPLPDEDSLPPWVLSPQIAGDLVTHWSTIPSHRGGR
jgi:hypothetical protein